MKKIILYVLLFLPGLTFAQTTDNNIPPVRSDYLQKSKNQKTAAWVLLGGGLALTTTGVLIAVPKTTENLAYGFGGFLTGEPAPENDFTAENILLITGITAMVVSIPLFIASGKNKKRAMNMTTNIKIEKATLLQKQSFVQCSYPSLAVKISL